MSSSRVAVISDIHGNIHALNAVLAHICTKNIEAIVNLGDSFYGPLFPGLVAERLIGLDILNIMGNQDRVICEKADLSSSPTQMYVRQQLLPEQLKWISSFPCDASVFGTIYACHGSPHSDEKYLLEEVTPTGLHLKSVDSLMEIITGIEQSIIVCGHSHVPRTIYLPNGRLIVNAGSVGLPAYRDDLPFPHRMESKSPYAKYVILTSESNRWTIEHVFVPYDWNTAAQQAEKNNRVDWAEALVSGKAT